MKKSLYLLLAGLVGLCSYWFLPALSQKQTKPLPADTIVCFGDSLTFGTGATKGMDYPSQLSRMLSRPVINAGVPGDTTARALQRLQRDVLSRAPDVVLITLGGNDLKNGIATDLAFANLRIIVESIQKNGARVIVGGLQFPIRDRGFGRAYQQLAERTGALLIPNILAGILANGKLMSDPIHPNDDGYKLMAEKFYQALHP